VEPGRSVACHVFDPASGHPGEKATANGGARPAAVPA